MVKKDSLIKGTIILAAAALVARVLGIFQKVPLEYVMDDIGNGSFGVANNVYLLLLIFSTAGIPSAISKMVSERYELGREEEAKGIYKAAVRFGVLMGIVMTILLLLLAPAYASFSKIPEAALAIQAIAPALLVFPVIAMMRGYFQGRQFMIAGGISQVVEQIARVITAVGLVFLLQGLGYSNRMMAAGGAFGSVLGGLAALAVMLWYGRKLDESDRRTARKEPQAAAASFGGPPVLTKTMEIYKAILRISIPILLTAMTVQLIYIIDNTLLGPLSEWKFGPEKVDAWLKWLVTNAQSIAGIPPVLAIALSTSILPVLAAAYASRDEGKVRHQGTLAMRIAIFTGMPVVLVLTIGAHAVNGLLFSEPTGSAVVAMLCGGTIFQITMMTSNSILNGISRQRIAMVHTLTGVAAKLALSLALTPFFGIYGLVAATSVCFIFVTAWNMATIRKATGIRALGDRWFGFASTVLILAAAGSALVYYGLEWTEPLGWKWPYLIVTLVLGLFVCVAYLVLLVLFRVIRVEDLDGYPARIRKLLGPLVRRLGRARRSSAA
ncbi:putative polysaccharide biosynthesis protein [Cohnella fermenti]|uniref:Polysaccharide biosynthesis protein n=1 Tax=Cohnella fermenti TaxID=2565925 RepID=A0A4S4C491_9BACL|nr:polysaccharide biosynthesis protein [Cohnella fermenti]THF82607.1 polysaccharide biosynthesis protein [Cohnella fermenti]